MKILAEIQYHGETMTVEVIDAFEGSRARKLATVKALVGQPFAEASHGGWCASRTLNVLADRLANVRQDPAPAPTLLALALAAARDQWVTCEKIYIWGDQKRGAYLEPSDGFINLYLAGSTYRKPCPVFYLDWTIGTWRPLDDVKARYTSWTAKVQEAQIKALSEARAR